MKIAEEYKEIEIYVGSICLKGSLRMAENSLGIVLFSHGTGSSRFSIRNNYVAGLLLQHGYSTLLFDLLTEKEDLIYENRFDVDLLTERLLKVTKWARNCKLTKHLPIAYFGASTGAASALNAAAYLGNKVKAIILRGGRPDLAEENLKYVKAPTLLIVGGNDKVVIEINKRARSKMRGICEIKVVEGASHLFSEVGKLEIVAKHTCKWLDKFLKE